MAYGKIKFYNDEKKFGFITKTNDGDVFFHISGVTEGRTLNKDDKVEFDIEQGKRGEQATNIVLAE